MNHYRQQELQAIIKTQESKVHSLQKELALAQNHEQQRISEALAHEKKMIEEKDKTIAMLMEEAQKAKNQNKQSYSSRMAQMQDMYRSSEEKIEREKRSQNEVQSQIVQITEHYECQLRQQEKEKEELVYQMELYQRQRRGFLEQIQKLNKFYVESNRQQPEREETLLWVDKLIEFISKTNEIVVNEAKEREQALLSITLHVTQEMKQLNIEYSKSDTVIAAERMKFLEQLHDLLHKAEKDYNQAAQSSIEFGQKFVKVKNREEKEIISKLESQLEQLREGKEKELNSLYETLSEVEKDKKNLLVNIQQLKSYYELKEKANKQEVDFLKKTLQNLLDSQEQREKEFEREIVRLGEQIEHLTIKFYEKIQLPINAVYSKIKEEVSKFKQHFEGFFSDSNLQKQIQHFQLHIVQYLTELNQQKEVRQLVKETARQARTIINFVTSNLPMNSQTTPMNSKTTERNESSSLFNSVPVGEKIQEKRLNYELATARKHIQKLKEHTKFLQSKSPRNRATSMINDKTIEIAVENELLKERIQKLQRNQKDNFVYNQQILTESRIGRINTAILERLDEKIEDLLNFTRQEETYILSLSSCINSLNQIIINPADAFQQLLDEIKTISAMAEVTHPQRSSDVPLLSETLQKKDFYRDILARKNEANININKTSTELMKVIRELLCKNQAKQCKAGEGPIQNQRSRVVESKQMLEKRVKEVHTQRLKVREEMLEKMFLLEEKIKTMEMKTMKKQNFPFIKFEESICKKLQELFSSLTTKEKLRDMDKIVKGALSDARAKLKDCQAENQGLIRQITMLKQVKAFK